MAGEFLYVMSDGVRHSRGVARASYNRMSWWYDALTFAEEGLKERGVRQLGAGRGDVVLEIGCGTGHSLMGLANCAGMAYGIDLSDGMCRRANDKISSNGARSNAGIVLGDAVGLPFKGSSFDGVFICFTLELFDAPEMGAVLNECGRVLRAGGRICVVAMAKGEKDNLMTMLYGRAHALFPHYVDCRPIDAGGALKRAGFKDIDTIKASTFGLPIDIVTAAKSL
jgi:demethylmenaquinone methyltransferase/2-methoxy-6-polyprenyl-1,4-benzoquinol methylase